VSAPRSAALAAVLAAVATATASCRNGDGDGRLSREEFLRRADAICADYDARLARLGNPASIAELGRLAARALPIAREGVAKLRALEPPEELARDVERWLARNDENVSRIAAIGEAAQADDATRVQEIASAATANERRADALARRLGLRDCAKED
jgi:cysteine sulfinate desulfinase/cysteine desulfurase-like protein